MTSSTKWVRASTALDSAYEAESSLLRDLEKTDESNRGKLLRALIRAGFKASRTTAAVATPALVAQPGGDHES